MYILSVQETTIAGAIPCEFKSDGGCVAARRIFQRVYQLAHRGVVHSDTVDTQHHVAHAHAIRLGGRGLWDYVFNAHAKLTA